MTTLIQANEVSPFVRGRVIAILNAGLNQTTLRVTSTAVGFEAYLKQNNIETNGNLVEQAYEVVKNQRQSDEVKDFITTNRKQFIKTALDIYLADLSEQFVDAFYTEPSTSTPDATGFSESDPNAGPRCRLCGGYHS